MTAPTAQGQHRIRTQKRLFDGRVDNRRIGDRVPWYIWQGDVLTITACRPITDLQAEVLAAVLYAGPPVPENPE
jgi:hypothetical protein